jgi:hypothetical protein
VSTPEPVVLLLLLTGGVQHPLHHRPQPAVTPGKALRPDPLQVESDIEKEPSGKTSTES